MREPSAQLELSRCTRQWVSDAIWWKAAALITDLAQFFSLSFSVSPLPLHFPWESLWRTSSNKSLRNHFGNCTAQFGRVDCIAIGSPCHWLQNTATDGNRCRRAIVPVSMMLAAVILLISSTRKSLGKSVNETRPQINKLKPFQNSIWLKRIHFIHRRHFHQGIHSASASHDIKTETTNSCLIVRYDYYVYVY